MVTALRNITVTVGTSAVEVVQELQNTQREALAIVNTSTAGQIIYLSFGQDAVVGQGIALYPAGSWSESIDNNFIPTNKRVSAVASAASGSVSVHERQKV